MEVSSLKQAVAERDVKLKAAKAELLESRMSLQQKDTELKVRRARAREGRLQGRAGSRAQARPAWRGRAQQRCTPHSLPTRPSRPGAATPSSPPL